MSDELGAVLVVLGEARRRGFLGPGPLEPLVEHSVAFAEAAEAVTSGVPEEVVDLGSGGGVPGLLLGARWHHAKVTLVEGSARRGEFLAEAVDRLGWKGGHAEVVIRRAEDVGRVAAWREQAGLVVARSFGSPPVTAECAAPMLRLGGWLLVSEPPPEVREASGVRWPVDGLRRVGLEPDAPVRVRGFGFQPIRKAAPCSDRYPRRVGVPGKRPLY
jgi:16S rRNA (guanine527-N7)-methyltransferase